MTKNAYIFELRMKVRDYECDVQGIVNNANYLHYLEHTRHEFLLSRGVSFIDMHERGTDCVVARVEMQFKTPLRSDEEFISRLWMEKQGLRYVFHQDIFRAADQRLCLRAVVSAVCVVRGRLGDSEELRRAFAPCLAPGGTAE